MQYVLQKMGSEYNDEIDVLSSDFGAPVKIFESKEEAEAAKDQLEFEMWRDGNPFNYAYGWQDVVNSDFIYEYNALFNTEISKSDLDYSFEVYPNMTFDQFLRLKPFIKIEFYKIFECE